MVCNGNYFPRRIFIIWLTHPLYIPSSFMFKADKTMKHMFKDLSITCNFLFIDVWYTHISQWPWSALVQLVTCFVQSHHLNQYKLIVNRNLMNELKWSLTQNTKNMFSESAYAFEISASAKCLLRPPCVRWITVKKILALWFKTGALTEWQGD